MRRIHYHVLFLTVLAAWALSPLSAKAQAGPEAKDKEVGEMNNAFGMDLYAQLAAKPGNVFFSPTSVQTALAMAWAGARGQTANEMAATLHLRDEGKTHAQLGHFLQKLNDDGKKGGYELAVANALWGAKGYPFMPSYLAQVKKNYDGHLSDLDFANDPGPSRQTINNWVAKQTMDKIQDLLPPGSITSSTRLVLTNAIYFKGNWDLPFDKKQTHDSDFTAADGVKVKAPFMYQQKHFGYAESDQVQVVSLPYGHNDLAMYIFLPRKADGLATFEKGLTAKKLTELAGQLRDEDVQIWLPRFKSEGEFALGDVLQAMGMKRAFDPNSADFSGMSSAEHLFISAVIHKAFIQVDEQGTEAAAATGVTMRAMSARVPTAPKEFKVDHPFLYAIVHRESGAILFMGRLAKP